MNEYERSVAIAQVVQLMHQSKSLLFITGAGMSAESGLPTYRGVGGLYDVDTTAEGLPIEEILSGAMLMTSPELTWKYLMQIESREGLTKTLQTAPGSLHRLAPAGIGFGLFPHVRAPDNAGAIDARPLGWRTSAFSVSPPQERNGFHDGQP